MSFRLKTLKDEVINYVSRVDGIPKEELQKRFFIKNNKLSIYVKDLKIEDKKEHSFKFNNIWFHRKTAERLPIERSAVNKKIYNTIKKAIKALTKNKEEVILTWI